ncbi:type II toxin-antitoxin system RelE/ParE family toxin [Cupriavidus sp. 8B]
MVCVGEPKVGHLAGIRVHKFKFNRQDYLMAYRSPPQSSGRLTGATLSGC